MFELLVIIGIILINVIFDVIVYTTHNDIYYMIALFAYSGGLYMNYRSRESKTQETRKQRIKQLFLSTLLFMSVSLVYILLKTVGWINMYTTIIYFAMITGLIIIFLTSSKTTKSE